MSQRLSYAVNGHCGAFSVVLEFTRLAAGERAGGRPFCGLDARLTGLPDGFEEGVARVMVALGNRGLGPVRDLSLLVDAYRGVPVATGLLVDRPLTDALREASLSELFAPRALDCALAAGIMVAAGELRPSALAGRVFVGGMTSRGVAFRTHAESMVTAGTELETVTPGQLDALARQEGRGKHAGLVDLAGLNDRVGNPPLGGTSPKGAQDGRPSQRVGGGER